MVARDPLATVRNVVHRATGPLRTGRDADAQADAQLGEVGVGSDGGGVEEERCEELEAMRAAEEGLGDRADAAARATRTADAYLAARRRRLRRQLEHTDR